MKTFLGCSLLLVAHGLWTQPAVRRHIHSKSQRASLEFLPAGMFAQHKTREQDADFNDLTDWSDRHLTQAGDSATVHVPEKIRKIVTKMGVVLNDKAGRKVGVRGDDDDDDGGDDDDDDGGGGGDDDDDEQEEEEDGTEDTGPKEYVWTEAGVKEMEAKGLAAGYGNPKVDDPVTPAQQADLTDKEFWDSPEGCIMTGLVKDKNAPQYVWSRAGINYMTGENQLADYGSPAAGDNVTFADQMKMVKIEFWGKATSMWLVEKAPEPNTTEVWQWSAKGISSMEEQGQSAALGNPKAKDNVTGAQEDDLVQKEFWVTAIKTKLVNKAKFCTANCNRMRTRTVTVNASDGNGTFLQDGHVNGSTTRTETYNYTGPLPKCCSWCTTMRKVEASWCEEVCTDKNSDITKAINLEEGKCDEKGYGSFLHNIASGIFVKEDNTEFPQGAGEYKSDQSAADCNVHHFIDHGMCEQLCVGDDNEHYSEKHAIVAGSCTDKTDYTKFIGEKTMKAYGTADADVSKNVGGEEEIAAEQKKKEEEADAVEKTEEEEENAEEKSEETPEEEAEEANAEAKAEEEKAQEKA